MKKIKKIAFVLILYPALLFSSSVFTTVNNVALASLIPTGGGGKTLGSKAAENIGDVMLIIIDVLSIVITLIIGLALVTFLWGVFTYIVAKSPEEQAKGKGYMVWGIIGLFVMVSVWALVELLTGTFFGTDIQRVPPTIPTL